MIQKTQHILVLIQDIDHLKVAIVYAFKLASIFKADVVFARLPLSTKKQALPNQLINKLNTSNISYKEVKITNPEKEPNNLIKELEAIFIVSQFAFKNINWGLKKHKAFKYLYRAKIPSFIVCDKTSANCDLTNIIVPVSYKKETKEKMIWASYFGRFNKAIIHLIVPNEKNESILKRIKASLLFTKKMYKQFNFEYKIVKTDVKSNRIINESFQISEQYNSDLIVLLSQNTRNWYSSIFGPADIKMYLRNKKNPILFINPLKDYYLPCS
ncbi:hypothetical protein ACT3CE_11905 [Marinifilum sp. RC60d5]|uniref:hypothetical protein n=1 Tax=Marinifilum sp. RC60d5 TaxID=3458414 RepID=UPI0040375496